MRPLRWLAETLFEKTDGPWIRTGKSIVMTLTILFMGFGMITMISGGSSDDGSDGGGIGCAIGRLIVLLLSGGR